MSQEVRIMKVKLVNQKEQSVLALEDAKRSTKSAEEQAKRTQVEQSKLVDEKGRLRAAKLKAAGEIKEAQDQADAVQRLANLKMLAAKQAYDKQQKMIRDQADAKVALVKEEEEAKVSLTEAKVPVVIQAMHTKVQSATSRTEQQLSQYTLLRIRHSSRSKKLSTPWGLPWICSTPMRLTPLH